MADDITNKVLLEHMQGMKSDLQVQITGLGDKVVGLQGQITNLTIKVEQGFSETQKDIQALQEDLDATIAMASRHDRKLARL